MPYKCEKIKLKREQDKRVKLSLEQIEEIKQKYIPYVYSLNRLAREYEVSKKTILLIVNENSKEVADNYKKNINPSSNYYDKDKHREYIKKHRRYKKELFDKGELDYV